MRLFNFLFEENNVGNDLIEIVGYHRSDNSELTIGSISMEPRDTRQKGSANKKYIGFYITMPKIKVDGLEDLPRRMEASSQGGENYGRYIYKISLEVLRGEIILNNKFLGSTRITQEDLTERHSGKKFIYVPRGLPTAEGIVLDTSIIKTVEEVIEQ